MTLLDLFATPRVVTVAGIDFAALPLRLRDLAEFEALAALIAPDPFAELPDATIDTPETRRAFRAAMEAAESVSAGWGGQTCYRTIMGTVGGRAAFLAAVLRPVGMTVTEAAELVPMVTPDEWERIDRLAFGLDPSAELVRRADAILGIAPWEGRGSSSWAQAVAEVCELIGKAPHEIADMTLPEFRALRCRGVSDPWKCGGTEDDEAAWSAYVNPLRFPFWNDPLPDSHEADNTETHHAEAATG